MCTSDIKSSTKKANKTAFNYLCISLFCALFGGVYEYYGHGVISFHMIYAFAIPLVFGTLFFLIIGKSVSIPYPERLSAGCLHLAVATATVGSIFQGVLDIYGTTNRLSSIYIYASAILIVISIVKYVLQLIKK